MIVSTNTKDIMLVTDTVNTIKSLLYILKVFPIRFPHGSDPILKCCPRMGKPFNVIFLMVPQL